MTPINSRAKGKRSELELVHLTRSCGWPDAERSGDAGQSIGDIARVHPLYLESRHRQRWSVPAWLDEISREAPTGTLPILCLRRNHDPIWKAALPDLSLLLRILASHPDLEAEVEGRHPMTRQGDER